MHVNLSTKLAAAALTICSSCFLTPTEQTAAVETTATLGAEASKKWITSLYWIDDQRVVATSPGSLLVRPSQVLLTNINDTSRTLATCPNSLWKVIANNDRIFMSSFQGEIYSLDRATMPAQQTEQPTPWASMKRWTRALAIAADGRSLIAGDEEGTLTLWTADGKESKSKKIGGSAIFDLHVDHISQRLAVACGDGSIKILDSNSWDLQGEFSHNRQAAWCARFYKSKYLISSGSDRAIQLWDSTSGKSICTLATASNWVTSLTHAPGTDAFIATSQNGEVILVDCNTRLEVLRETICESGIWAAALSPNGQTIAFATRREGIVFRPLEPWLEAIEESRQLAKKNRPPTPIKN